MQDVLFPRVTLALDPDAPVDDADHAEPRAVARKDAFVSDREPELEVLGRRAAGRGDEARSLRARPEAELREGQLAAHEDVRLGALAGAVVDGRALARRRGEVGIAVRAWRLGDVTP